MDLLVSDQLAVGADGSVMSEICSSRFDTAAPASAGSPVDCLQPLLLLTPLPPDSTSSNLMSPQTHSPLLTAPLASMLPALLSLWTPTLPPLDLHC